MTDKTAVEAMARELAGHFGPLFEELPKDKGALRAWRREGFCVSDNTQDEMIGAAQAALDALKANGFAVVPVDHLNHLAVAVEQTSERWPNTALAHIRDIWLKAGGLRDSIIP